MSSGLYSTKVKNFSTKLDLTHLKPYGDTMNDGKVQVSFTLPVKDDDRSMEAARQLAVKMGLEDAQVSYHGALDKEFTFYGSNINRERKITVNHIKSEFFV